MRIRLRLLVLAGLAGLLAGCTFSRPGPLTSEIRDGAQEGQLSIVRLREPLAADIASLDGAHTLAALNGAVQSELLQPGDVLKLSIIETPAPPPTPMVLSDALQIPELRIGEDGTVFVPFAGSIMAQGRSIESVRETIEARLSGRLYEPQVVISRTARTENTVSIFGSVAQGGTKTIEGGMRRLGDLVGMAQPQVRNQQNARVLLLRDGETISTPLLSLYRDPANSVPLLPGDVVTVTEDSAFVTVLGAAGLPGRVEIIGPRFTLVDAIAEARGLSGAFADPEGVYLLRSRNGVPDSLTIYEMDMRDPVSIAAGSATLVQEGDVIVAATATFSQTRQLLGLVSQGLGVTANITRTVD